MENIRVNFDIYGNLSITDDPLTGSNYIIRPDGKRIDLRFVGDLSSTAEMIDQGFIVERQQLKKSKRKELVNFRMIKMNNNAR